MAACRRLGAATLYLLLAHALLITYGYAAADHVNLAREALPALINELADVSEQFVLVLDDYHAIEDGRIHEGMASLIEHLPETVHVAVVTTATLPNRLRSAAMSVGADIARVGVRGDCTCGVAARPVRQCGRR